MQRDEELWKANAISEQTLTNQRAAVRAQEAKVAANRAILQKAKDDLANTIVYASMSGRLGIDDVQPAELLHLLQSA